MEAYRTETFTVETFNPLFRPFMLSRISAGESRTHSPGYFCFPRTVPTWTAPSGGHLDLTTNLYLITIRGKVKENRWVIRLQGNDRTKTNRRTCRRTIIGYWQRPTGSQVSVGPEPMFRRTRATLGFKGQKTLFWIK